MNTSTPHARVDVRAIEPRQRHALIFATFDALPSGQYMELVNDHDPLPLYHHFNAVYPQRFAWDYLEQGPQVWRVAIAKVGGGHGDGSCCGGCGGA